MIIDWDKSNKTGGTVSPHRRRRTAFQGLTTRLLRRASHTSIGQIAPHRHSAHWIHLGQVIILFLNEHRLYCGKIIHAFFK